MKKIIEVKNLSKIYDQLLKNPIQALNCINFSMDKGEFVCVMGPSGAGKSTFLNCISLIDIPTEGSVKIDGIELNSLSMDKIGKYRFENLGLVFQDVNLLSNLTIYDNIAIPLTLFNKQKKMIDEAIVRISMQMGINDLLEKYPFECSGGQIQRAAICKALINTPKILIADEPTGNLDSKNTHEVMSLFRKLNKEGVSILLVTHDPMVASYSERVIYIKDGTIENDIKRNNLNQSDYFYKIIEVNSSESLQIINPKS